MQVEYYKRLFNVLMDEFKDKETALFILQELRKDARMESIREEKAKITLKAPEYKPATDKQKNLLKKLKVEFPNNISKIDAMKLIDENIPQKGVLL